MFCKYNKSKHKPDICSSKQCNNCKNTNEHQQSKDSVNAELLFNDYIKNNKPTGKVIFYDSNSYYKEMTW